MPRIMRGMARTAVIAGTATATAGAVNRRQAKRNAEAYGSAQQQAVQQPAAPAPAPVPAESDTLGQLERLAQLKAQGILTEDEFAAQKAKILGM